MVLYKNNDNRVEFGTYKNAAGENEQYVVGIFPINLFIINEGLQIQVCTAATLTPNHYALLVNQRKLPAINFLLKLELFSGGYSACDHATFQTVLFNPQGSGQAPTKQMNTNYYNLFSITRELRLSIF